MSPIIVKSEEEIACMRASGAITGEITSQDILSTIFQRFCIGK